MQTKTSPSRAGTAIVRCGPRDRERRQLPRRRAKAPAKPAESTRAAWLPRRKRRCSNRLSRGWSPAAADDRKQSERRTKANRLQAVPDVRRSYVAPQRRLPVTCAPSASRSTPVRQLARSKRANTVASLARALRRDMPLVRARQHTRGPRRLRLPAAGRFRKAANHRTTDRGRPTPWSQSARRARPESRSDAVVEVKPVADCEQSRAARQRAARGPQHAR